MKNLLLATAIATFAFPATAFAWDCDAKCMERILASARHSCENTRFVRTGVRHVFVKGYGCLNQEEFQRYLQIKEQLSSDNSEEEFDNKSEE